MSARLNAGWPCVALSEVARIQTGIAKNSMASVRSPVRLPYLRVANVQDGYLDLSDIKDIEVDASEVGSVSLEAGDVLLTEGGDFDKLGRGAVWRGQIRPCLHQNHVFAVRADRERLLPEYLAAYCGSPAGKRYFLSCSKQTTNLASINSSQLKAMPLPLPPFDEQRRIADALAAWDRAIETAEPLVAAKRRRLHLTIKVLSEGWEPVVLGDLGRWVGGGTPSKARPEYWRNGTLPWVSPKDMRGRIVCDAADWITEAAVKESATTKVPRGSVLVVTRSGILRSRVPVAFADRDIAINQDLKALQPRDGLDGRLLSLLMLGANDELRQATMKTGTTVESLDFDALKAFALPLPRSGSDTDMASGLLVGMADELDTLDRQTSLLRKQKRGLMQKLLTGDWRLEARPTEAAA